MDIYKLSDKIPDKVSGGGADANETLKITGLKAGVKNPERVNIFVNGKYTLSLGIAQVVDLKLKVGMAVTEARLGELKEASEFGKLYQRTLEWVLMRPRSARETRDYLAKKLKKSSSDPLLRARRYGAQSLRSLPVGREESSEDIFELFDEIIKRLLRKGYLNDRTFAEWYVTNRFVKKGVSQKRLRMELMKKGIAREVIEEVLAGRDDDEELKKMILKKQGKYGDKDKLIAYLCRQGFSYDLAREKVAEMSEAD